MASFPFRYDINGLRAIAVIAVLIFHYNHAWLQGGFTGVDIFFVISGYLITTIILKQSKKSTFSLIRFYKSRIKRIVPALLMVCIILIIVGYALFEPMTYKPIGQYSYSSLLFVSNFVYYTKSGYFDASSDDNFLLHTWSLSVEWQFYLIYPIILLLFYKIFHKNTVKLILILITITSFSLNIYFATFNSNFAFYMLPTRIWELLIGALAFLYPIALTYYYKKIVALLGIAIIIISLLIIPATAPWSSYFIILPVAGAYLLIISKPDKIFLSNFIFQLIGKLSYSIYLVHWPIIVFFRTIQVNLNIYSYILLTSIFSSLLYVLIERKRNYSYIFILSYLTTILTGLYISINGISARIQDEKYKLDATQFHQQYYGGKNIPSLSMVTSFNKQANPQPEFILTGDSHARQYGNYFLNQKINFIGLFADGCLAFHDFYINILTQNKYLKACIKQYDNLQKTLRKNPNSDIIMVQRWDLYEFYPIHHIANQPNTSDLFKALKQEIEQLIKEGGNQRHYFIIGRTFDSNYSSFKCNAKKQLFFYKYINPLPCQTTIPKSAIYINDLLKKITSDIPNVYFIDPNDAICSQDTCKIVDNRNNPILSNEDHLSIFGADIVGSYIWHKITTIKKHDRNIKDHK
ncbi:acyltransferase family protein [Commensalibacter oyaizuii]|uniref:Acyltransferase family protein n=1 Tax=Commensalibacter oyaizuii TaxID=3043873 RepID=A0ABT6PYP6_9PROT|nr:acyltransferase family protein [Commensalibacter sp. TBRC 16381]MDI2089987.1 acyltransferase family protein [Commensalibacter sp. TBRC 16381]